MKLVMRNWPWLAGFLILGSICATYLIAQTQTSSADVQMVRTLAAKASPPNAQETADSARLINAVNAGDIQTAVKILRTYGMADNTLLAMVPNLGKIPAQVELKEPFLKASVATLTLTDRLIQTNVQTFLQKSAATADYVQPVWEPRRPDTKAIASYDSDMIQCPVPPIAVFNLRSNDACFIRYFKLYDRYAEYLHSVVLNGPLLSNSHLDERDFAQANRLLSALFQLVKARKPDAFVWLNVVKEDDHSDEQWLKAMTFTPDGLQISNLRQFNSPFVETRERYMGIVGTNMPMMVSGFYGHAVALQKVERTLTAALKNNDRQAEATAIKQLGGLGSKVGQNLEQEETNLQSLGYRGLSAHWLLLAALANSTNTAPADQSELLDSHAGLLDFYFDQKDYARVLSIAANMISNSSPGDMNWTAGKLYEGIALLNQTPSGTSDAIAALDEVIAFDFTNKPGRDHYILGAVKWRIYAASISDDMEKPKQLAQWVQNQSFRTDLKSAFLKKYGGLLAQSPATTK